MSPNVYIVTVGTGNDKGQVRLDMVEDAVQAVADHSVDNALVVMRSTCASEPPAILLLRFWRPAAGLRCFLP